MHFLSEKPGSQTCPQCAAVHSSFDTEKKNCSFPKNSGFQFLFIRSVFSVLKKNAGVDVSTVINRRKAVSGQIWRERLSISVNSGDDRAHIAMVSLLVPPNVAATIDQHISNPDQSAFEERDRETL